MSATVSRPKGRSKPPSLLRARLAALAAEPRRTVALPACAIAIGLAVALAGVFRPARRPSTTVPPGYVALVNQKGLLMSDFIAQAESLDEEPFAKTTAAQRRKVLRQMIDEELLVQRGVVLDLPETTNEVRDTMAAAVNAQVVAPLLAIEPSDAELHAFYDTHLSKYKTGGTMTVHDLVLHIGGYQNADQTVSQGEIDAAEAVYELRSGASIDYIKEHFGFVDSGRVDNSQQLDFAAKIHLGPQLYKVAETLDNGAVSDPTVAQDGIHVLVMDGRRLPSVADFSVARKQVYSDYRQAEFQRATQENLKILRSEAQILVAPGVLK